MAVQPDDLHCVRVVGAPTIGPGGSVVVSVQRTAGGAAYAHRLWIIGDQLLRPVVPEEGTWAELGPRFAPDGASLAFISDRGGRRQAWFVTGPDSTVRPLVEVPGSVRRLEWLDDRRVVLVADADPPVYGPGQPATIGWLRYKRDGRPTFFESTSALWLLPTTGRPATALAQPDGRITAMAVGAHRIAYVLEPGRSDAIGDIAEVRVVDVRTGDDELWWLSPSPVEDLTFAGPDGPLVAVSAGRPGPEPHQYALWLLHDGREPELLLPGADVSFEYAVQGDAHRREPPSRVQWVPTDGTLVVAATCGHDVALLRADLVSGSLRRLSPTGTSVTDFAVSATGRHLAVCLESPVVPTELFTTTLDASDPAPSPRKRTAFNAEWSDVADPVTPEALCVDVGDVELTGLLYLPPGQGPFPVLVRVHGGPHLAAGTAFNFEVQTQVSRGLGVLLPNVRGSAGRGQSFRSAVVGGWGEVDLADLMAFVDEVTARPVVDAGRLYLAGGSYGGFLTNWALCRTERFRAAISERSISNFTSKYGTSDNGFLFNRNELGGLDLFDDGAHRLLERSPVHHAAAIRTPLLLLHGEEDRRCPIEQSEQLFVALRRLGREAKLIRFAGESHDMAVNGRPDHRIHRMNAILSWLFDHGGSD